MDFRALLHNEFERRRARNPRYSLHAFARQLGTHHSTVSRILTERRRLTARRVKSLGEVNVALHYLIHTRRITMASTSSWTKEHRT